MQLKRSPLTLQGTSQGKHAVSRRRSVLSKFYRYKYVLPVTRKLERSNFVIASSDNHEKHEFRPMPMMVVPTHNYCPPDYQQHTDDDNIGGTCNSNSNIYSSSSASAGARSQSKSIPTSTQKDGDDKEGTINRKTSCSDIKTEETTIFRQLGILKRGGYWKHLPREEQEQEQDQEEHEEGMLPDERWRNNSMGSLVGNKDENKENLIRYLNHPNVMRTVAEFNEDDVEADDDTIATEIDDMDDDDCLHDSNSDPFSEYVLTRTDQVGCNANSGSIGSLCKGFYIHAITEDGWMCSNNCFHNSDIATDSNSYDEVLRGELKGEDNDKDKESRLKFQQLASSSSSSSPSSSSPLILLRLPNKVAALGREKMHVQEIGLVKRRDNGTVEPCNYYLNSDGDVIIHSASEQLYGRILL